MGRYSRTPQNRVIRADWWDAGEEVILRPRRTFDQDTRAQEKAVHLPENMTPEQLKTMSMDQVMKLYKDSTDTVEMNHLLMADMIVSWTLRYDPTDEQIAAGELGDILPLDDEGFTLLTSDDGGFIMEHISGLGGSVLAGAPASGESFPEANAVSDIGLVSESGESASAEVSAPSTNN